MKQANYKVVGVMSGTSLDGLDLAFCEFHLENSRWSYQLSIAETVEYPDVLRSRLKNAVNFSGLELALLNSDYGHFLGQEIQKFIEKNQLEVDLVSVHGHTIFHQPEKQLTLQIGDGAAIASYVKCPVVTQFRNIDVALGGQGAPLVPIGDKLLFDTTDFCLNLGGIANISFTENSKTIAFDICVCNMALNYLVSFIRRGVSHTSSPSIVANANEGVCDTHLQYDKNGEIAKSGTLNSELLTKLNDLDFHNKQPPKSLGFEWFENNFLPILDTFECPVEDKLHTVCEHIAEQVSKIVNELVGAGFARPACYGGMQGGRTPPLREKNMLVTGGGAKNDFLMSRIKHHCLCEFQESNPLIVDFKEALIFAFLGVLRLRQETNCLSDVTGATHDNIGGCVYLGNL
ncbi:MAG: anhydro-N-acetylmuramic acid kinase [Bacteroidales bacterium]|nr:anhydro-N-acetylmuramic acid kinase [Bacteroidales bacterium]